MRLVILVKNGQINVWSEIHTNALVVNVDAAEIDDRERLEDMVRDNTKNMEPLFGPCMME